MTREVSTTRGHNEGSIFQRRSGPQKGTWVSTVTMRDGRRASRVSHSRDEAKAELAELLRLRDARAPVTGRIRLGAYLERWVSDDHGWAPKTARRHEQIVRRQLVPGLGGVRLSDLRPADVSRFLAGLRDLAPQSRRHVRATLRRALADAIRDGLVLRNAAGLAQAPALPNRERPVLDAAQARLLIESTRGTRYGPLWTILVTTGLRISEALGLAWSDVDLGGNDATAASLAAHPVGRADPSHVLSEHGRGDTTRGAVGASMARGRPIGGPSLTVRHQLAREHGEWVRRPTKTAKGRRTIPLTALGVEALRAQREMQREDMAGHYGGSDGTLLDVRTVRQADDPDVGGLGRSGLGAPNPMASHGDRRATPAVIPIDGLVFTSPKGQPLYGENTVKALYAALDAAGLPRVTQHDLRHSCATLLYAVGVPLETISDVLGHSATRITADLYRHRVDDLARAAADRMQEALG